MGIFAALTTRFDVLHLKVLGAISDWLGLTPIGPILVPLTVNAPPLSPPLLQGPGFGVAASATPAVRVVAAAAAVMAILRVLLIARSSNAPSRPRHIRRSRPRADRGVCRRPAPAPRGLRCGCAG